MVGFCTEQLAKDVFHGFGVVEVIPNCIFHVVARLHKAFPCRLSAFNMVIFAGGNVTAFNDWILLANKRNIDRTKGTILMDILCITRGYLSCRASMIDTLIMEFDLAGWVSL